MDHLLQDLAKSVYFSSEQPTWCLYFVWQGLLSKVQLPDHWGCNSRQAEGSTLLKERLAQVSAWRQLLDSFLQPFYFFFVSFFQKQFVAVADVQAEFEVLENLFAQVSCPELEVCGLCFPYLSPSLHV